MKYKDPTGEFFVIAGIAIAVTLTAIFGLVAFSGEACDGVQCSNMNEKQRMDVQMDLLGFTGMDIISDAYWFQEYASQGNWGSALAALALASIPFVSIGMARGVRKLLSKGDELVEAGSNVAKMGGRHQDIITDSPRRFTSNPWDTHTHLLMDADKASGGGKAFRFRTAKGYEVQFHTGHVKAGHNPNPHYQIYAPIGISPSGRVKYSPKPIERFNPDDKIPQWLDF